MKRRFGILRINLLILSVLTVFSGNAQEVVIDIDPTESRAISGHMELNRQKYFNLSHGGKNFEAKINSSSQSDRYLKELEMSFGRDLGMVNSAVRWGGGIVREDASRPGYIDVDHLRKNASPGEGTTSSLIRFLFPENLGIANHDNHNAYPEFMEQRTTSQAGEHGKLPINSEAAGELAANLLKYNFTDWTRPATFEPINEPHWAIDKGLLAGLHLSIWEKAKELEVSTLIGGPCSSVGYYYKKNYQSFSGMKEFIDNTECKLDFYSFHVYDYLTWNNTENDFTGRISTGLPIEGVLDLMQNYTKNQYGKDVQLVFSEHGGYIYQNQDGALDFLANKYFPGSGFEFEMKRRSISNFIMVNSAIANTMTFMNHPDIVKKAVPFILLESFDWDPYYYSSLLVADNFTNKTKWQESQLIHFYEFFKEVKGRRVQSVCADLDIQQHAFVDGNKLFIVLNNLSDKKEMLKLNLPEVGIQSMQIRRLGRNEDLTPYIEENVVSSLEGLKIEGYEKMVITVEYQDVVKEKRYINEVPYYGDKITKQFSGSSQFKVEIPDLEGAQYAILRVGISRPAGTNKQLEIAINNNRLTIPYEDHAHKLENNDEYASTKIIRIDTSMLQNSNSIIVKFSEGKLGGVGSVVLRVGYLTSDEVSGVEFSTDSLNLYKGEEKVLKAKVLPQSAGNKMLEWESLSPDILSVSTDGSVKALENGMGKVVVKTVEGNKTDTLKVHVSTLSISVLANKSNWEVIYADNETGSSREAKENVIDDRTLTMWSTTYRGDSIPELPHELWIDLKEESTLTKFQYLPRQDSRYDGTVDEYELYVTNDTLNWGEPVAKGEFIYDKSNTYWHKQIQNIVLATPATGRYVKFKALSEAQNKGLQVTSAAEFYAYTSAKGISIPDEITLEKGEKKSLPNVLSMPGDGVIDKSLLIWSSSNPEIVSVGYATMEAKSAGVAEITVSTIGGQYSATSTVEVTIPTSVEEIVQGGDVKIYPNPVTNNQVNLVFPSIVNNLSVKLYNVAGGLIAEESFFSTSHALVDINRANYQGVAIVKVVADNEYLTEKVVVQ